MTARRPSDPPGGPARYNIGVEPADLRGPDPGDQSATAARAFDALDELPEATVVLAPVRDGDGTVTDFVFEYANRVAAAALGAASRELTGRRVLTALPAFPLTLFEEMVTVVEDGSALRTRVAYRDAFDGRTAFSGRFDVSASRIGDRLLVVYEDVTARDRAHAAERRFGAVIEATSDWVSITDRDAKLVFVNAGGRRMVGLGPDEDIVGLRIGEFSPAWARERVLSEALPIARRDGVWRGDLARLHRDGHEIPVSQVIVARTDVNGEVEFYATIARDMTREREAQAALRASEERFRIAFEQGPVGVSLLDLDGNFVQVNDAYCQTVRRSREELLGKGAVSITHPDDMAFTRYALRSLLIGEVPVFRYEKRYIGADGEIVWTEVSASIFRDAQERPQFIIGIVLDVGERRVAHTLQRSMLTTQLPEVEGVELAVRYLPSSSDAEVSGDWYDVIALPDGRVGIVIGDVVGRGVEAAATMSQLRTALRAYAVEGLEPAEVVAKLHRLVRHLRVGLSTTLAYLDLDPFTLELRYVSAGHLPVLHVPAGGSPRFLTGARSTPLGAAPAQTAIPQERLVMQAGDSLLLYTDGLVERRDASIDSRLEELRATLEAASSDLATQLEQLTTTLTDGSVRTDDIALLALRAHGPPPGSFAAEIGGVADDLRVLRADLRAWLAGVGAQRGEINDVLIAVGEACSNSIEHAGAGDDAIIDVRARMNARELMVTVGDRGVWRAASAAADRGHGLRLMRVLSTGMKVATAENGTRVELRFRLDREAAQSADPTREQAPDPPDVGLALERAGDVPVARLHGEIDLVHKAQLGAALAAAVQPRDRGLVLDLTPVAYLDSAGVHLVHELALALGQRGQSLRVVAAPGATVVRVLELVDLERTVPVDVSVQAAVAALTPPPPW
jgi:anti-anti-sigma factor